MGYILVVEDHADLNEMFARRLEKANYSVKPALSVQQAIEVLANHEEAPDLIVLDLDLPDGRGADVLRVIHNAPKYARTRVIVVSAKAYTSEDGLDGFVIDHILVKPVSPKHLVMLTASVLEA